MNAYFKIRENLKDRVHPVNLMVTLNGVDPFEEGHQALRALIKEGQVEETRVKLPDSNDTVPLYKLAPGAYRGLSVVK